MPVLQVDNPLIENYLAQFDRLNPEEQRIVFTQLSQKRIVIEVPEPKPKYSFEELCDAWCADERSTEEIIRDIYDSRTFGRERDPL